MGCLDTGRGREGFAASLGLEVISKERHRHAERRVGMGKVLSLEAKGKRETPCRHGPKSLFPRWKDALSEHERVTMLGWTQVTSLDQEDPSADSRMTIAR